MISRLPAGRALLAAALLLAPLSLPALAQLPVVVATPELQCRAMKPYVAEANRTMPQPADDITENIEIRLDCNAGTITYVKRLVVAPAALPAGWERLRQAQHTATYCSPDGATSRYGLVAIDEIHGPDGAVVATLTTTPVDCARVAEGVPLLTPAELDAHLEERAVALRATLPARVDDVTTLLSIFHGTGALIYFYQLGFAATADQQATFQTTALAMHDQLCLDPEVRLVIGSGGSVTYRYSDNTGAPLFTVAVTAAGCAAPP